MTKGTTFIRRRGPRPPDPYVIDRGDGRFDMGCRSCRVVVAGMVDGDAANVWAERHRCADTTSSDRRP